jgi:hypothetical protein
MDMQINLFTVLDSIRTKSNPIELTAQLIGTISRTIALAGGFRQPPELNLCLQRKTD